MVWILFDNYLTWFQTGWNLAVYYCSKLNPQTVQPLYPLRATFSELRQFTFIRIWQGAIACLKSNYQSSELDTIVLRADEKSSLPRALEVLRQGGLVAFPTDTVYGLGALAFDDQAVKCIYDAKGRSLEKAIPVLIGNTSDLLRVASDVSDFAWRLARRFWPGPLTLVLNKNPALPDAVSSSSTVGVREPDHKVARALLLAAGPMAVTSANRSGGSECSTAADVLGQLEGLVQLVLDGGKTPGGIPSTILDCTQTEPALLRAGPLSLEDLRKAFR